MNRYLLFTYSILLCIPSTAQKQIRGRVVDERGSALFATVSLLSGYGTSCDSSGHFVLELPDNKDASTIYIQSLGYNTDTILVTNSQTHVTVCLKEKAIALNEVAVVSRRSIESKSSVAAFTTTKKEMAQLNPQSVGQVLQTKAGFTNKSGYQAPLTLRGMSGKRILVLRNGNRRFSSYPAGVMSHTINVYDLERIEVEKGAASVIYGAGAMAGIVNLVDKSPFKQDGLNAKITGGYGSVNREKNMLACGGWSNGKFAVKAGMRYRNANNFSFPDGSIAENSFYTDKDIFVTTGYKFSELQNLVFTLDIHNGGPWGKPVGFNGTDYMRVQTHEEKTTNYSLKYSRGNLGRFSNVQLNAFYSNESRELVKNYYTAAGYRLSYIETTHFSDYYFGAFTKGDINITEHYSITTGAEMYSFHISTPIDAVDYIETFAFENRMSNNARSNTLGIFLQNNWQIQQNIQAVFGARYNFASVYEGNAYSLEQSEERNDKKNAFSGNAAAIFRLNKKSKLKLNTARSFRMPETTELYSDNYTSNGILYGNPDLKPEYCNSVDASYLFKSNRFNFELSPFFWLMENMITKEEITGMPGTNYTYVNIGKSRLFGGEVTGTLSFDQLFSKNDKLTLRAGAAYLNGTDITDSESILNAGMPLDYVPPFNVKSDITYNCIFGEYIKFNMALRSVYYSEQKRLGDSPYATPQYLLIGCNMGMSFLKIKSRPSVNIAVNNLLNTDYYSYQSYLPGEGRDIRAFITINL